MEDINMTEAQINKFLSAVESAEINEYCFVDDITAYYKNGQSGACVYDSASKTVVAIQLQTATSAKSSNPLNVKVCDIVDIHRAEVNGTYAEIKKFIDAFGLTLSKEQNKVLLKIDANNKIVKPVTGDYSTTYQKLSKEQQEALTPEEKKEYDEKVEKDQERLVGIPEGRPGIVVDSRYTLNRDEYLKQ